MKIVYDMVKLSKFSEWKTLANLPASIYTEKTNFKDYRSLIWSHVLLIVLHH